jgi:uncharacterized SAM-binding protein YcdF (DUF218 family)
LLAAASVLNLGVKLVEKTVVNQHLTRFLIVSDPLHMKRAVLMAQDMGEEKK